MFNPINEIKDLVCYIEGKIPTEIEEYLQDKADYFEKNGIFEYMHVGKEGEWTKEEIAEWLISQFVGTIKKSKENKLVYNTLGTWLRYVYHYIMIDNN